MNISSEGALVGGLIGAGVSIISYFDFLGYIPGGINSLESAAGFTFVAALVGGLAGPK